MGKYIVIFVLGIALFMSGAWYLGLFNDKSPFNTPHSNVGHHKVPVANAADLGEFLYTPTKYLPIEVPKRQATDPIVLRGLLNAFETEDVPSQVQGRVLFIGDQVDESAVLTAGSAAFLAEPYYYATIYAGKENFVRFYRRHYEGDTIKQGQMLGMVEPSTAFGAVLEKIAKVDVAKADLEAAKAAEEEGLLRWNTAEGLWARKSISREDYGAAKLTWLKFKYETISADKKVALAENEKNQADIELKKHEIRSVLPYRTYSIKSMQRTAGTYLKQLDPVVMTVQSLERLLAEAAIDEQYAGRLKENMTATIEPTVLEAPLHELPGHELDVNSVAVSRDLKIVSGSEDKSVCVWAPNALAPLRKMEHDDTVKVVACSPVGAKENICLAGCGNGDIYLWDLNKEPEPYKEPIRKAHGNDASITALAFSPDGKYFASGGSDGSIKLWTTEDGALQYAFIPQNGVETCHDDAVTSLNFTPQCRLISAGRDNTLRVWQLHEKGATAEGKAILNRKGNVANLGVSHDGQWMLFDQGHTLKLYSVESRKFVHTLNLPVNATPFDTLALFSPDGTLMLTAGAPDGRLQLWSTPNANTRGFEVRELATREKLPVTCAAFSPDAGKPGAAFSAVSASGHRIYLWSVPTAREVEGHRIQNVPLTLKSQTLDPAARQIHVGFEVANPKGRFEAGRPVTIVID